MEPLKEMFGKEYYAYLSRELKTVHPALNEKAFQKELLTGIETLSLNERMRNTSVVLKNHLPADYRASLDILYRLVPRLRGGYTNLVFPDYVALYGTENVKDSLEALKFFTMYGSSEFAIRTFLKADFQGTLRVMEKWAKDKNHHVRRLASEGSRPRLPWSFKLDAVVQNPALTRNILETLNADPELYVRKSVANHLNDISKEHPEYMLDLVRSWDQSNQHTAWIIKHASRTLIKKGHQGSLSVFDFEKNPKVTVRDFKLEKTKIKLGECLEFSFELVSGKNKPQKLVVDYIVHYRKKSGELSPKVFKLKELTLDKNGTVRLSKKQWMKDFTTRTHFGGRHKVEIQVNGAVLAGKEFELYI